MYRTKREIISAGDPADYYNILRSETIGGDARTEIRISLISFCKRPPVFELGKWRKGKNDKAASLGILFTMEEGRALVNALNDILSTFSSEGDK